MRDIRFRAWDSVNKVMVDRYEDFWLGHDGRIYIQSEKQYDTPNQEISQHSGEGIVLMQFTGLKDKNGKEIWEGDVVCNQIVKKGKVIWMEDFAKFGVQVIKSDSVLVCGSTFPISNYGRYGESRPLEVLGNIYENQELLK